MKKIFYTILIIIIITLGLFVIFSPTAVNNELPLDTESEFIGWQDYTNSEYSFSLKYPNEWENQEALKPQEIKALHEILFFESDYEMHRASLTVRIFNNNENKSVDDWWNEWLSDEDIKKEECVAEYGEGNAPCLFLRGLVESDEQATFANLPARTVRLFRFDSSEECTFVAYDKYIYGICSDGKNPNDPNFTENKDIYSNIRESFGFEQFVAKNSYSELLEGRWTSLDDDKYKVSHGGDGILEEYYDGEIVLAGSWSFAEILPEKISAQYPNAADGLFLIKESDGEVMFYIISSVTDTNLTLIYLDRGNTLKFVRDTSN
ncbi:hypothetical protein ACFL22_00455 [Patescibacteria group bacterium]